MFYKFSHNDLSDIQVFFSFRKDFHIRPSNLSSHNDRALTGFKFKLFFSPKKMGF